MTKNTNYIIIIFILFICIFKITTYIIYKSHFNSIPWNLPTKKVHIIITRYNEESNKLNQLLYSFINKKNTTVFIYNKGDDNLIINDNIKNVNIIKIDNLGWDSYAFIMHVINNYNNLPDYIYNIHASTFYLRHKYELLYELLNIDINNNDTLYYGGNLYTTPIDFRLSDWDATTNINKNTNNKFVESDIYPLNNWILSKIHKLPEHSINNKTTINCNMLGMFLVHKNRILRYPKSFYIDLLKEISVWQSEVNHYLERSWYTFYGP